MKKIISIALIPVLFFACSQADSSQEEKKIRVKEVKREISQLEQELETLQREIQASDSGSLETTDFRGVEVTVKRLKPELFEHFFEVSGSVETDQNVIISPQTNGQIREIYVSEGDKVKKGQKLARLNTSMLQNNIEEVKTQLDLAETVYKKQKNLWDENIGSEVQYLEAKNKKESLEKRLNTLYSQLDMSTLTSPINGQVDEIFQREGEFSGPQARFARVVNLKKVKVVSEISEKYLTSIEEGDTIDITFPVLNKHYRQPVTRIGNYINPQNRGFKVEVEIENGESKLKPNLIGILRIKDFSADSVFVVPTKVIGQDSEGTYLYTTDKNSEDKLIARKTYVETGKSSEGNTMLKKSEISEGQTIIIEGYSEVSEGSRINIVE